MTEPAKAGRPTDFNKELAAEICVEIACSSSGLRRLCNTNEHWPEPRTIYRWLKEREEFSQQYARAKQCQIEALVDEMLEIADNSLNDRVLKDGRPVVDHEHIQRAKLMIDTRKWLACKLVPKVYGDRIQTSTGLDDSALIQQARDEVAKLMAADQRRIEAS